MDAARCSRCGELFDVVELIRNAEVYHPLLGTLATRTPCCLAGETIRVRHKALERGFVYGAGGPHFSAEEEYRLDELDWEESESALTIEFNGERKVVRRE